MLGLDNSTNPLNLLNLSSFPRRWYYSKSLRYVLAPLPDSWTETRDTCCLLTLARKDYLGS